MLIMSPIKMVFHLIYLLILYGFVVFTNPLIGGFLLVFYILYYSFFRWFMGDYNSEEVSKYAADSNKYLINETSCKPLYWYEKLLQFILKFCMYMHRHIDIVAFVIMLVYSLIEYSVKLKSNNLKVILIMCNIILIICCIIVSYILEKNATPIVGGNDIKPNEVKKDVSSFVSAIQEGIGNNDENMNSINDINPDVKTNIHKESNDLIMNSLSILKSASGSSDKLVDENQNQNKDKETMSNIIGMSNSLMKSQ